MAGGLIQLITTGKQDSYLTETPQITFFRKIYRRHTIFGIELIEIPPDQQPEYNNKISFKLNNISDLISKCYIEIEIPQNLNFIENSSITALKQNELSNINKNILKWKTLYNNLKQFCSIEILLYQKLNNLLQSININLNILKLNVSTFNSQYKKNKDELINLIFDNIYNDINLSGYILQLNLSIVLDNYINYDPLINIYVSDLQKNIKNYYTNMIKHLKYYYLNWQYNINQYNNINNNNVKYTWIDNLAHYYFTNFEIEIGGRIVESYSADQSFIYQKHHIKPEFMENYNKMISVNNNKILILPLNFFFCKDIGCALPTVAMSNSSININLTLNNLQKLLYFKDIETDYYKFLKIDLPFDKIKNVSLNIDTIDYNLENQIAYIKCSNINYQLLALKYPSLSANDKNDVLTNILNLYGILVNNEKILELNQWINYKQNFKSSNLATQQNLNVLFIDLLNDYNYYYSLIPKPNIKLITESIYLDDIERNIFSSYKLEYVVELFQENIYDLTKNPLQNYELSIDRPIKELMWITQPKLFLNGLTEYGKCYNLYDYSKFFTNKYYNSFNISLNQIIITKSIFTDIFYNELQSYKYYNNNLPNGVSAYNFGLFPEENQPSGTCNFSQLKGKVINIKMKPDFINEYFNTTLNQNLVGLTLTFHARCYNFFIIEKGMAIMIFASG